MCNKQATRRVAKRASRPARRTGAAASLARLVAGASCKKVVAVAAATKRREPVRRGAATKKHVATKEAAQRPPFVGGGGTCAFVKPSTWATLSAFGKKLVTTAGTRVRDIHARNETNWAAVTGQALQKVPVPDVLQLHFPNGAPCPEQLILVQTCDVVDHSGEVHAGMQFAFNVLHVARQTIVAACEAQTLADEVHSGCPLPFVVLNPVTQTQFGQRDLQVFQDTFTTGFRALSPKDLKTILGNVAKHVELAGNVLYYGSLVVGAVGASDSAADIAGFAANASNAFFLASGAVGLVSAFSNKSLADFAVYQATVYGSVPTAVWYAHSAPDTYRAAQRLMSSLYSQWKSRSTNTERPEGAENPAAARARFDVRTALDIDNVARARAAEMAFDEPPVYTADALAKIQSYCTALRTTCSIKVSP